MGGESTIDYVLDHYVGGSGRWQMINTLLMSLVYYAGIFPLFLTVFTAYAPDHRCVVPDCDAAYNGTTSNNVVADIYGPDWLEFAIPVEKKSSNFLAEKNAFDGCTMYKHTPSGSCQESAFSDNETVKCDAFLYDNTYFDETLATRLDLVCDKENLNSLLGTVLIIGLLFGSLIGGRVGDRFGRKCSSFAAIVVIIPITIGAGYVQSFNVYAVLHCITCACLPVIWVNTYVYQTESFSPKWRMIFVGVYEMPIHYYIFCLIVYLNRTWSGIHLGVGIACACALPVWFFLPESPRWLAQNNHTNDAMTALKKIAQVNKRPLSNEQEKEMQIIVEQIAAESHKTEDNLTPLDMFRKGHLVKSLILCFGWITSCISFYALTLNATQLSGNIILNFTLSVTANIGTVIVLLLTANNLGRRRSLVASHVILALSCIGLAFVPKTHTIAILIIYMLGKILASVSFTLVYLITIELYPTNLRSQAVGSSSTIARVFCACAPFLAPLANYWQPLPMLILGVPTLISGLLCIKLPETYEAELPQTMDHAKELEEYQAHHHQHKQHGETPF